MPERLSPGNLEAGFRAQDFGDLLDQFEREQAALEDEQESPREPTLGERDREAQRSRANRLRDKPALRSLLTMVQRDASLRRAVRVMTQRSGEFKDGVAEDFIDILPYDEIKESPVFAKSSYVAERERFRNFTALFSGLRLNARTSEMLDVAEQRTIEEDTRELWERIESGDNFVEDLVIGSGPAAANYVSTRKEFRPQSPSLSVSKDMGGEFKISQRPFWRLNSRNRPVNRNISPVPGTEGSLNEIGKYAVVQPSDLGNDAYQDQSKLGDATMDNLTLLGNNMKDIEVKDMRGNKNGEGILEVELYNTKLKKTAFLRTNRLTELGGPGEDRINLDLNDSETVDILAEAYETLSRGERPQVMTFKEAARFFGDETNDYPFQGLDKVIIVGDKDGGLVDLGSLKGYEPALGKTVRQIDNIRSVVLVAKDAPESREELLSRVRPRYAVVGNELPRENNPEAVFTTRGVKAVGKRLRRDGDLIVLESEGESGQIIRESGDLIILANGVSDTNEKIYRGLNNETITDPDEIQQRRFDIIEHPGTVIYYKKGPRTKLEIIDTIQTERGRELNYVEYFKNNTSSQTRLVLDTVQELEQGITTPKQRRLFAALNLNPRQVDRVEYAANIAPEQKKVYSPDRPEDEPIAVQWGDWPVYRAGAAARLPLPERIKGVAAQIPENSASLFVSSENVTALAKMNAEADNRKPAQEQSLTANEISTELVNLPNFKEGRFTAFEYEVIKKEAERGLPTDANLDDRLNIIIGDLWSKYRFPDTLFAVKLSISQADISDNKEKIRFTVFTDPLLPPAYKKIINELMNDVQLQKIAYRLTERASNSSGLVDITIPLVRPLSPSREQDKGKNRQVAVGSIRSEMQLRSFD